jgi:Fe-S oxidoreductase
MIKILEAANIDYAVLGNEESCTGDSARRLGEEYLFETMALQNIETFNKYKFNKIITPCPHCFHTIGNEYGDFDGNYEAQHHSQFIMELIKSDKLKLNKYLNDKITYHDACYLGRHNGEYEAPRNVINSVLKDGKLIEMDRNRVNSFCCGAGGGNMWYDIEGGERINSVRFQEAIDTGVDVVATACSFCTIMMDDALKVKGKEDFMQVLDIAELVADAL